MADAPTNRRPYLQMSLLYQGLGADEFGRPLYFGIFGTVQAPLPTSLLFVLSNQYTNGYGAHQQHTTITDPDGNLLAESPEAQFMLFNITASHRVDERFGVHFTKPGRYTIRVFLDGALAIEHFFMVEDRQIPPDPSPV